MTVADNEAERGEGENEERCRGDLVAVSKPVAALRPRPTVVPRRSLDDAATKARPDDFANVEPTDGKNKQPNAEDEGDDSDGSHQPASVTDPPR